MKNFITTTIALLALTVAASATDLPSKAKAPAAPAPVAAPAPTSNDSLTVSYAQDLGNNFGAKVDDSYSIGYTHQLGGGFSAGFLVNGVQKTDSSISGGYGEAQVGYKLPAFAGVVVGGKAAVGERVVSTGDFPYYALYGTADYAIGGGFTLNAVQYRWRSAIDSATYGYQSHQIGTGVTYDITSNYSVNAKIYRGYDTNGNATGDGVGVGLTVKF
jgi:hypothetical protein